MSTVFVVNPTAVIEGTQWVQIDIAGPDLVEVEQIKQHDQDKIWINVNGVCVLRIQGIKHLKVKQK